MKRFGVKTLLALSLCLGLAACSTKAVKEEVVKGAPPRDTVVVPDDKAASEAVAVEALDGKQGAGKVKYSPLAPGDPTTKVAEDEGRLNTVHFDYDKYNIRDEDKSILDTNARWLKLNARVSIRIEGHADERGDNAYNLALGDKRASSVKKYLSDTGIPASRLSTVSYGEEKPVDPGHVEDAWAKNRRAEFMIGN